MAVQLGAQGQPGFDQPIALMVDCHRRIEHFLSVIERVVARAECGPFNDEASTALQTALRYFRETAPNHTADEEDSLFPELRALQRSDLEPLLERAALLETQHRKAEAMHERVHDRLDHWLDTGQIESSSRTDLLRDLAALRSLYQTHIAFEDDTLFPTAKRVLDASALQRIGRDMAERRGIDAAPGISDPLHLHNGAHDDGETKLG